MVSFLDYEGTDPASTALEAAEAITAARNEVEAKGIKGFLFQASSPEEFDQRVEFSGVPEVLDEVADKYLGSPDQRAKLTAVLRREFVAHEDDKVSACPACDQVTEMGFHRPSNEPPCPVCDKRNERFHYPEDCPTCKALDIPPPSWEGSELRPAPETKQSSDPCGGCPAGTKCVCTHDGCKCVKTSKVANRKNCESCGGNPLVPIEDCDDCHCEPGEQTHDEYDYCDKPCYTNCDECDPNGKHYDKAMHFKPLSKKTAEKGDACENCQQPMGPGTSYEEVHACNNCDVSLCENCARDTCPYCGETGQGYYDWNSGERLSSKTARGHDCYLCHKEIPVGSQNYFDASGIPTHLVCPKDQDMDQCYDCGGVGTINGPDRGGRPCPSCKGSGISGNPGGQSLNDALDNKLEQRRRSIGMEAAAGDLTCEQCDKPATHLISSDPNAMGRRPACEDHAARVTSYNVEPISGARPEHVERTKDQQFDQEFNQHLPKQGSRQSFAVCPTCEGRGSHVNPSIDSQGLSAEDFDEDPDFREDYMSGAYDVKCAECHGEKVVPRCTQCSDAALAKERGGWSDHRDSVTNEHYTNCYDHLDPDDREERDSEEEANATAAAERRMGA